MEAGTSTVVGKTIQCGFDKVAVEKPGDISCQEPKQEDTKIGNIVQVSCILIMRQLQGQQQVSLQANHSGTKTSAQPRLSVDSQGAV